LSRANAIAAALFALLVSSGCWEQVDKHWFDQMKNGPAVQTLAQRPFMPAEGTIPAGGMAPRLPADYPMPLQAPEGRALANPIAATAESIARGKHEYEIYCSVCHGADGLSIPGPQNPVTLKLIQNGAVVFPLAGIPAYTDGMIFYKIWYGKPNMPGYPQISEEDRWHIINYMRTLFRGAP
jgi:mono/diheme cytochrome c family protein